MHLARASILLSAALGLAILTGCAAQVPLHSESADAQAKQFAAPAKGKAGLYIFRDDKLLGAGLYKDIYVDGVCLGETAPGVFFYTEVEGNKPHKITTEGEVSDYEITINTEAGKHYFVEQYITFGLTVWGANIREVEESYGKAEVMKCQQAIPGTCASSFLFGVNSVEQSE